MEKQYHLSVYFVKAVYGIWDIVKEKTNWKKMEAKTITKSKCLNW